MFTSSFLYRKKLLFALSKACKKEFILACISFLLSAIHTISAQSLLFPSNHKRCVIKTINIENGLLNNTVTDIVTDTFGFTWVATKTGLQRYNGYRLENIQPVVNGREMTIDYQVYFLLTGNHTIWMSCKDGLLQYNPFQGNFTLLVRLSASGQPYTLRPLEDTREGIWCSSEKSLVLYNHEGKLIKEVFYPQNLLSSFSQRLPKPTNDRYIFMLTDQNRIVKFDKTSYAFSSLPAAVGPVLDFAVTKNKIYLLEQQGISVYRFDSNVLTKVNIFYEANRLSGTVKIFGDGILASVDHHLLYLDSNCTKANELATLTGEPFVSTGSIKMIYQDGFNRLWVLTSNDIKLALNYNIPFQYFAYKGAVNFSKSIYADDKENHVLAGFYDGGIQLFDTTTNPLWKTPLQTDKVKDIAGIEKLGKNEYFITTLSQGWYTLDLVQKRFTPVVLSPGDEEKINTHRIVWTNSLQRLDSSILITTPTDVWQCRFLHNRLLSANNLFHDETKQIYYSHYNQNDHCLWVTTSLGLVYGRQANGKTDTIATPGNYQVRCLTTDSRNYIWVGTDKGLFVYNSNRKLIHSFSTANGLLNDCIYSLLIDKKTQTIYASTNLGLSAIQPGSIIKNYTKERGLQENEFNSAATATTQAGKLYFGGVNGITAFYPSDITVETDHPSLVIYKTDINDETYTGDSAAWNQMNYHLAPNQEKISFSLSAFGSYQAPDYTYKYKMEGFDKYWSITNNPVNISYHLPPGIYHFKAQLVNFPSQVITRTIIVGAPFWQRWWFYVLIFLFLVLAVWIIIRNSYQRHYKEQLQRLQIRQQVLAERERISRDLHDNIGAYASAISANVDEVIYGSAKPDPATLQKLKESAREIIVQLRDSIWALNKETQTVIMLSDRIKNYIQKLQPAYPAISFDVEEEVEQNATFPSITALNILRIVQEAVHNAIKHSGCSSICVSISSCSPVVISVEDNGRGMPLSPVLGDGVKNMQARAADIGWHVNIRSQPGGCTVEIKETSS